MSLPADRVIAAKKSALIIQDLQNDVIIEGGAFASSGAPAHAKKQNVVANVAKLAAAARKAGMPVIHVHYAPLVRGVKGENAMVRGSWGAAAVDGLEPQPGDFIVEKTRMNGFHDTNLETLLKGVGAETMVISGAWTNMSIEHTARHGADAGYEIVVVSDGTSTVNDDWQRVALEYAMTNVGDVATVDEVIAALR
jgi:gluconolactonase